MFKSCKGLRIVSGFFLIYRVDHKQTSLWLCVNVNWLMHYNLISIGTWILSRPNHKVKTKNNQTIILCLKPPVLARSFNSCLSCCGCSKEMHL